MWYIKVLLIKKESSVVLQSSKYEEITFTHEGDIVKKMLSKVSGSEKISRR